MKLSTTVLFTTACALLAYSGEASSIKKHHRAKVAVVCAVFDYECIEEQAAACPGAGCPSAPERAPYAPEPYVPEPAPYEPKPYVPEPYVPAPIEYQPESYAPAYAPEPYQAPAPVCPSTVVKACQQSCPSTSSVCQKKCTTSCFPKPHCQKKVKQ